MSPRISVVTAAWNRSHLLKGLLRSFDEVTPAAWLEQTEVIVVDNGSVDDTAQWLAHWSGAPFGPRWKIVVTNETNRGFAAGINRGLRAARGTWVLIVNNDVVFESDPLGFCLRAYEEDPRSLLGPKLIRREGPWNGLRGSFVRYLEGWCLFASADILRELGMGSEGDFIGVFDETFSPAFFEDVDLSLRATLRNIRLREVPIPARHLGSQTTKGTPGFPYMQVIEKNRQKFLAKWEHLEPSLLDGSETEDCARSLRSLVRSSWRAWGRS